MRQKKIFLCSLLWLSLFSIQAQSVIVKGVLKDIASMEVISSATISTKHSNIGTISNDEGVFELTVPQSTDTIMFSHLGYKPYKIAVADVKPTDDAFYMESQTEALEEVIVSKESYGDLIDILVKTSKARFNQPLLLHSYFREFVKINDEYKKFSDGQLDYLITRSGKDIKSQLNVKQARAVFLPEEKEEDELDFNNMTKISGIPSYAENFNSFDWLFSKKSKLEKYDFLLKSKTAKDGTEVMTLYFQPKEDVEESLYKGSISYNPKTNLISNITIYQDPDFKKYITELNAIIIKITLLDYKIELNYKETNGNYLMSNYISTVKIKLRNKRRYNHVLEFKNDLLITNFTNDISTFDKKNQYKERSLYKYGNKHTYQFWKNNNAIVLTNDEEAIIKRLENNQ
ncbi:carboxypeptidase-like regulatory domain-containing protein [Flavobacterium sp.]|uniref:carboxypeptidase-like regulatory domain-containing protein n=1 Tax=Flavobacterium sp. TaxID=239 RepID=UPI002FDAF95E